MEKAIEITNLVKKYGNLVAVDSISISVEKGEIYAILGANGAGKTSTIKMVLGIINRTSGEIKVFGKEINEVKNLISFVPEEKTFYDNLTPKKAINLCKNVLNFNSDKMEKYLEKFRLPMNKKISTFSHGMKTLLYLSISFSENAELYIFDEPTWGLDPLMRDEVLEEIRKIAIDGKTVFYTSHILPEVEKVVDKIAIMDRGKILFEDYLDSAKENFKKVIVPKNVNTDKYNSVYEKEIGDTKILYLYKKEEIEDLTKIYPDAEITNMNLEKIFQAIVKGDRI